MKRVLIILTIVLLISPLIHLNLAKNSIVYLEKDCIDTIDTVYIQIPVDSAEVAIGYLRTNGAIKD